MTAAVIATGLVKDFEKGRRTLWQRLCGEPDRRPPFRAVDGIDLRVETGEIFGLLGSNGAGKTTTMKMLSTLLEPTCGTIEVLGIDVARHSREVRARRVNAIGQRPLFDPMLEWAALLGATALAIFVGRWAFARAVRAIRVRGTLAQY